MLKFLYSFRLQLTWFVSVVATSGSLYFSEIKHFIPCTLCWYQRILMYPLVILLGIALVRNDQKIHVYVLPLSILGFFIGTYHYLKQKVSFFQSIDVLECSVGVPCSVMYINWFGFITIPFLSLVAFFLISVVLLIKKK